MENNGLNLDKLFAEAGNFLQPPTNFLGLSGSLAKGLNNSAGPKRLSSQDMIIGAITNYEPEHIEQWIVSIEKSNFPGKRIALVYNAKKPVLDKLQEYGFTIWALARATPEKQAEGWVYYYKDLDKFNVCLERFWHTWIFLKKLNLTSDNDVRVYLTDTKDVVFQRDPSNYTMPENVSVMLTSEGLNYENEPWGWNNITEAFGKNVAETMRNVEISNAGVIVARLNDTFLDFLQSVYFFGRSAKTINGHVPGGGGPDQASVNIIANMKVWKPHIAFIQTTDDWCLNAGTTNDPNKNFGDKFIGTPGILITPNETDDLFVFITGVKNIAGQLYHVVHQYDRNPEWNEYFKKEYRYK